MGMLNIGPSPQCTVYWHEPDEEYRAELVPALKVPGMLVGYSEDSPELAKDNLRLLMEALGVRCEEITWNYLTE